MLRKIDSRYIILILVASPVIFVIYYSIKIGKENFYEIMKSHYTVIGEVVNVRHKVVEVEYEINGKKYIRNDSKPHKNIVESERYECYVSKKDISKVLVLYSRPLLDTINYDYDTVRAVNIEDANDVDVLFEYYVKGVEYDRVQNYTLEKKPKKTKNLFAIYRKDMPEIGYLIDIKSNK